MIFFAPWRQTSAWINHPRNIAVVLITVLTLSGSLLLSAGDSAAQTSSSWSYCASEGGQCDFSGTREVRYGANGIYAYGVFSNGVSCNNGVFGDPLSGTVKECQIGNGSTQSSPATQNTSNTSWSYCASEGGQCDFSGTREVRYGANGIYAYGVFSNGVSCNNGVFGDPLSGTVKECQIGNGSAQSSSSTQNNTSPTTPTNNSSWSYCASEGGQCNFSGTMQVRYGANGIYSYGIFANSAGCNNGVFGDPLPGYVKACEIENGATQSTSTTPNPVSTPTATTNTSASYYVGKNGSNSYSCSQARSSSTPKLTIGAALACIGVSPGAGAGEVVEVAGGIYTESLDNNLPSGASWSAPFTLRAKSSDTVTVQPSGGRPINMDLGGAMFTVIDGFVLDGANTTAGVGLVTLARVSYVRVQNNEIKNANVVGVAGTGLSNSHIYIGASIDSHNIEIMNNDIHDGSSPGHGIYNEGSYNLIENNKIFNIGGFGVQSWSALAGNSSNNNIVRGNEIYNFGLRRVTAAGILLGGATGNQAYNNIVYDGKGQDGNGGIGISVSGSTGSLVNGNTVFNNSWIGLDGTNSNNATITNNNAYGNNPNIDVTGAVGGFFSNN